MTRRDEILLFIAEYTRDNHNAPSLRQIAANFGITHQCVSIYVHTLIDEGRLEQSDGNWKIPINEYVISDKLSR